ncbi:MAG: hypothetical protein HY290_27540 [Planctomycetia bacterium]|nr:hypothetical protein [Planctomycetia bacterium]
MAEFWVDDDRIDERPAGLPPRKRSWLIPVLLACGVAGGGALLLVCCGGLFRFGMGALSESVWQKVESDPRFTAHVGQVKKSQMVYGASFVADEDVLVFDVEGTKWNGRVTVKYMNDDAGDEQIIWVRFTLPSGEIVELKPKIEATD